MAQIPRPPKQGNVMTYVAKVAAGYPHILSGEMDADLDTIYGAWNAGADTVNIRDGAITSAKLAADAVGPRELADAAIAPNHFSPAAVTTPALADGAVTDPKIASVAWSKVTGAPTVPSALPPTGAITAGDLAGSSYPSPVIAAGAVTAAKMAANAITGGAIAAGAITGREILDGSVTTAELADGGVTRAKLAVNAANGASVYQPNPTGFSQGTPNVWTTYATLPSLTTRGGAVLLCANPGTSVNAGPGAGTCNTRWLRDGTPVAASPWAVQTPAGQLTALPGLTWVDTAAPAGTHVYSYQVLAGTSCVIVSAPLPDGGFFAMEIG